ncbi:MAG TPA: ABC transporter substrate-binding protein [Thermopetrobacter sp.]|nr:ABC transporter substrate-binding protein [Thermopetrobacter sp.]
MMAWRATALLIFLLGLTFPAAAAQRHGLSAFGDLKYPPDFTHFDYVNPGAPKGGRIVTVGTSGLTSFDSFNAFILKGDPADGLGMLFDSLMVRAFDEPDAVYGLLAAWADVAEDGRSVAFGLRPEARFADGTAVTAEDVCFSFSLLKEKGHPSYRISLKDVAACVVIGQHTLRYTFRGDNVRDLPRVVGTLPVFSRAFYTRHDFTKASLVPPVGSGPYRIVDFKQGAFVSYQRRKDYWAADLPVNRGRWNFDVIKFVYFRERAAELEALKAGDIDLREEFTSRSWATEYDIPAVREGRLIKGVLPDHRPSGAQGFFFNLRRAKFADARVRRAFALAYDFEWANRNLFYGLYKRTESVFENSPLKATGKPSAEELKLLEPLRDKLPPETFGEAVRPPVSDGSGQDRKLLREASRLLAEAGWTRKGEWLVNDRGERFTVEFLMYSPAFERVIAPYVRNLRLLGIDARMRLVESAQFQRRLKAFDFDITTQRYVLSLTPGIELRNVFSAAAAKVAGSYNIAGIANAGVDALIEKVIAAKTRPEMTTAAKTLDRALRATHFWVPHWYKASHTIAWWDKFGRPKIKPAYARGVLDTWWLAKEKARRLAR